jgi:3-oxoacyl-[acyl-carrier protein] reductase
MCTDYTDKVVLVTGSRRGVGRLIAEHFLDRGATVVGFARGEATFDHRYYHHIQVDLGKPEAVQSAFFQLKSISETVDILVNNAAVLTSQYAMILPVSAAQSMVNVNILGAFVVARETAKMMRKKKWGRIIGIGSMAVSLEPVGDSVYAACKAGLITMNNVLAKELSSLNITCNTLAITAIDSDMLAQLPRRRVEEIIAQLPLPRFALPDDILNVIDFFCSERSSYITAQTVYLGGVN